MDKLHSLIWLVSSIQWKFTTAILQSQLPSGKRLRNELENHQCSWVNPLFLWPCSSSQTLSLPEGKGWPSRYGPMAISSMAHVGDPGTGWTDGKRHFWIAAMKDQFIHMKNAINTYIYINTIHNFHSSLSSFKICQNQSAMSWSLVKHIKLRGAAAPQRSAACYPWGPNR